MTGTEKPRDQSRRSRLFLEAIWLTERRRADLRTRRILWHSGQIRAVLCEGISFAHLVACLDDGEERKADAPPWGLDTVVLPRDEASLRALAAALPAEVAGRALADREFLTGARYGARYTAPGKPDAFVGAVIRENVEGFEPGMTAAGYLELLARGFEKDGFEGAPVEIEARALEPAGPLVYLVWSSTRDGRPWHAASWAESDGDWLFGVSADTPEARAALVAAFAEATSPAAS